MTRVPGVSETDSPKYRPDIDGLRALAVLPVLLFHAHLGCPGGFVGVDIFFVISGFLISSLIFKELEGGHFSLIAFWERRIRRILPAVTVVVLATFAAAWCWFMPPDFESFGKSVVAQALLGSNVFFYRQAGYFAAGAEAKPLLHTWSLAVEEQFYLFYPLLLVFLARDRRRYFSKAVIGLAAGSFALSVVGSYTYAWATFYLLPTRAWELLIGAMLVTLRGKFSASQPVREAAGWLGLGLVCYPIFFYDGNTRFPGLAAMPPCLGAALIIFSSESKLARVGRILAFKPVVFIGLISYSLYLWHWPLLAFAKYRASGGQSVGLRISLLLASTALAVLSWKYVETPFRKRRIFQKRRQIFSFAGGALAVLLVLGYMVVSGHGWPARIPAEVMRYVEVRNHRAFLNDVSLEQALAGQFVELGATDTNQPIRVLIWGDSHAMAVTPVLDELCRRFSRRGMEATHSQTTPVLDYVNRGPFSLNEKSPAFARAVLAFIAQRKVRNVILAAAWPDTPALKTNLLLTVRAIMDTGAKVFVLKDVPNPGFDVPRVAAITAINGGDLEKLGLSKEKYDLMTREFSQTFDQISQMGATVLDPSGYFLNRNGLYGVVQNGQVLYCDDNHLSVEGSIILAPLFEPIFKPE